MVSLTRFDGSSLIINADLIEFVEATPDTVVTMTTGRKVIVRETPHQVAEAVIAYKQKIYRGAIEAQES